MLYLARSWEKNIPDAAGTNCKKLANYDFATWKHNKQQEAISTISSVIMFAGMRLLENGASMLRQSLANS